MGRYSLIVVLLVASSACDRSKSPGETYFDRQIAPILNASCVGATAPCHRDDGNGVALGNLDLSSFDAVQKRTDVLRKNGSYPEPLLLIKAVSSNDMTIPYGDEVYPLETLHAVGAIMDPSSDAFFELKRWLDNGATENGVPPIDMGAAGEGPCNEMIPPGLDPDSVPDDAPGLAEFDQVESYLVDSCGAATCHGTMAADYYVTCGNDDRQTKTNYLITRAFVASEIDDSELLTRPLNPTLGGHWHTGGVFFPSRSDGDYQQLRTWAETAGPSDPTDKTVAREFFDDNVMPVLLQRGCAATACHSPIVPHKLRLRAGSDGFFSPISADRNYAELHKGFIALGSPDPMVSRAIAKNFIQSNRGIDHRAGPILETPGASADPEDCPAVYDAATDPPICTIKEWMRLERAELPPAYVTDLSSGTSVPIVYVERPADAVRYIEFADHRPNSDLLRADALLSGLAEVGSMSGRVSLLDTCPGVNGSDRSNVDVRAPEVSLDGTRIAFAMRIGAGSGLDVYEVGINGTGCRRVTTDGGTVANGITVENFDPYYVNEKDGTEWLVYASTRGGPDGPIRTPKYLLPGADLWREPTAGGAAQQMTFLRGVESQPAQMGNGMLIMTKEKATNDFYQISGRRLNWDLSDYHPLLANRARNYQGRGGYLPGQEPADVVELPSVDYEQATEIRQGLDGNFIVVFADRDTRGEGGALGLFNRSIGPMEVGRSDAAFVPSLIMLPGPTGRAGEATGAYRSPFPLPNGDILASYAAGADVGSGSPIDYDLVIVDPRTGDRTTLLSAPGSQVEAVLVYARPAPKPLTLPQTGTEGVSDSLALVHFPDLPLLSTILDSNNRRGRSVESLRTATHVRFFAQAPPPSDCTSPSSPSCSGSMTGPEMVYESRQELGTVELHSDGSTRTWVPAQQALLFELLDEDGTVLFRLREEFQFGPNENIGIGVPEGSFDTMCGGCHGSVTGRELDVAVFPDAVTSASSTTARESDPVTPQ
jgi:hypothetical protein